MFPRNRSVTSTRARSGLKPSLAPQPGPTSSRLARLFPAMPWRWKLGNSNAVLDSREPDDAAIGDRPVLKARGSAKVMQASAGESGDTDNTCRRTRGCICVVTLGCCLAKWVRCGSQRKTQPARPPPRRPLGRNEASKLGQGDRAHTRFTRFRPSNATKPNQASSHALLEASDRHEGADSMHLFLHQFPLSSPFSTPKPPFHPSNVPSPVLLHMVASIS